MCVSPVLNKVLSYDIIRQTKVNGAFLENDAIGCYDRLVNNLVFLELKRLGVPNTVCHVYKTHGTTLAIILKPNTDTRSVPIRILQSVCYLVLAKDRQQDHLFGASCFVLL